MKEAGMHDRAEFEAFAAEWSGRDMDYHRRYGTFGLGPDSWAWACWVRARQLERERCRRVVRACCGDSIIEAGLLYAIDTETDGSRDD